MWVTGVGAAVGDGDGAADGAAVGAGDGTFVQNTVAYDRMQNSNFSIQKVQNLSRLVLCCIEA